MHLHTYSNCIFQANNCELNAFDILLVFIVLELSPSDIGLSNTLEAIAEWHNLAVNLGVSIGQVQAFKSDPVMGALLALKYWRDGKCGEKFPSTWRFLLLKIETTFGGKVAKPLERKASGKPTWSQ